MGAVRALLAGCSVAAISAALLPAATTADPTTSTVVAFPSPGDGFAAPQTNVTLRGADPSRLEGVTVVGSASGRHAGALMPLPRGLGVTFDPTTDFRPGEQVTVQLGGARVRDGDGGRYSFTVAAPGPTSAPGSVAPPGSGAATVHRLQPQAAEPGASCTATEHHFVSRPDLGAVPGACVAQPAAGAGDGKIFVGYQDGPTMLNDRGQVVWHQPPSAPNNTNFRVVQYHGRPMLSYYRGYWVPGGGQGQTDFVLLNDHYQQVATVHAANGYLVDEHEFTVTPQGTAFIGSLVPVVMDLSKYGGRPGTVVYDYVVQEIDIATNELLFEWHALDHISITESQVPIPTNGASYDWFHGNAIDVANDGNLLISSRHTSTIYKVDRNTGDLIWKLGGKDNSFPTLKSAQNVPSTESYWFCFQHHIRQLPDGTYTLYDNGGGPGPRCGPSRGLHLDVSPDSGTATILGVYRHDPDIRNTYMGDIQTLPNGDEMVGWGNVPRLTEFHGDGSIGLDLKLSDMSYRAFRSPWTGHPTDSPAIAWRDGGNASASVYVSWNGATEVASWQLQTGNSMAELHDVGGKQPKAGFETRLSLVGRPHAVRVQALGADGSVLGASPTVFYSNATGAHVVREPILGRYSDFGTTTGNLGYPTTDTTATPDGVGRYNHFSGADGFSIYWTRRTGAHEIQGAIRSTWASLGWERSRLGYPNSDEYGVPDGRRSDFEHGSIVWDRATGATRVIHD